MTRSSPMPVTRGIYVITCLGSGHQYVGSSVNIAKRWRRHRDDLNGQTHHSRVLQRAWNKWGAEQFRWEIVEVVPPEADLTERERVWHRQLKPAYNGLVPDRALRDHHSEETRKRMSERNIARWQRRRADGTDHHSASVKAKIGAAHRGLRRSERGRKNMSEAAKRRAEREKGKWEAIRAARTFCIHGHPWTPENLYTYPSTGAIVCLTCKRAKGRESERRRKLRRSVQ